MEVSREVNICFERSGFQKRVENRRGKRQEGIKNLGWKKDLEIN